MVQCLRKLSVEKKKDTCYEINALLSVRRLVEIFLRVAKQPIDVVQFAGGVRKETCVIQRRNLPNSRLNRPHTLTRATVKKIIHF
jgi:hypothetical protein